MGDEKQIMVPTTLRKNMQKVFLLYGDHSTIYHDENGNGTLDSTDELPTTKDTTTIPGSTIFTASVSTTSPAGVGGKSGSTGASSTGGNKQCDSNAFGKGESLRIYEISYDLCEDEQLSVIAESYCGPVHLSIFRAGGIDRGGLSMNQTYLDEHKVVLTVPISQDYDKFRVLVENDKSDFERIITPKKLDGLVTECQKTITITHDTGYLSKQTSSFVLPPESEPGKSFLRESLHIADTINYALFNSENNDVTMITLEYDPEPCVDTWDDSCVIVDPEPCVDTWDDSCIESGYRQVDDKLYFLSWFFDFFSYSMYYLVMQ